MKYADLALKSLPQSTQALLLLATAEGRVEGLGQAIDKMLDRLFQMKPQSERTFAAVGELLSRWKKPEALSDS